MEYSQNPGGGGSDATLYEDAPEESGEPKGPESEEQPEESGEPTATLPKSILAGKEFEPGDEVVLRIDKIMEDMIVVSYAPSKKGEGEGKPPLKVGAPQGDSEMASMLE